MHSWTDPLKKALLIAVAALAVLAPSAGAATVVNGDFETGNLDGWQVYNSTSQGNWYVFSAAKVNERNDELEGFGGGRPLFPPTGNFAAYTEEEYPDTAILYQDVTLEPYFTHQLSMTLGYTSAAPIAAPNTLAVEPGPGSAQNQQLRVDVVKPTAPLESLNPEDILATPFANKTGDPQSLPPQTVTSDLSPFAGQTIRIRIANAVHEEEFNAMVDNVSLLSAPIPNEVKRGKLNLNKRNGSGRLALTVPGPGILIGVGKGGKNKKVKRAKLVPTGPGTVKLALKPTAKGLKILSAKGRLKTRIDVFFTPIGGTAGVQTYKATLKRNLKK